MTKQSYLWPVHCSSPCHRCTDLSELILLLRASPTDSWGLSGRAGLQHSHRPAVVCWCYGWRWSGSPHPQCAPWCDGRRRLLHPWAADACCLVSPSSPSTRNWQERWCYRRGWKRRDGQQWGGSCYVLQVNPESVVDAVGFSSPALHLTRWAKWPGGGSPEGLLYPWLMWDVDKGNIGLNLWRRARLCYWWRFWKTKRKLQRGSFVVQLLPTKKCKHSIASDSYRFVFNYQFYHHKW